MINHEVISQSVSNLELLSRELEKAANNPKNYNTEFGYYLEQFSFDLHRNAQELKNRNYIYGGLYE